MCASHELKVLLVDDEERLLAALKRRLSSQFNLVTTTSPVQALEYLASDPSIAVIVADMQMPEMNGVELLKRAQEIAPLAKRLMLTGNSDVGTAISAINDGKVTRFLQKPCESEVLAAAIEQALAERRFHEQPQASRMDSGKSSTAQARIALVTRLCQSLKAPLSDIRKIADLAEKCPAESHDEESNTLLLQLQTTSERILHATTRIREFSQYLHSAPAPFQHADLIAAISAEIETARTEATPRGVAISFDSLRREVLAAASLIDMRTAFRELLSNAVRISGQGGHISVAVKTDRDRVTVRIADTGRGVNADILERMHASHSLDDGAKSQGFGIALVEIIAEQCGAHFSLGPSKGGGAEAILSFARAPIAVAQTTAR